MIGQRPAIPRISRVVLLGALVAAALAVPNAILVGRSLEVVLAGLPAVDWHHFVEASRRVTDGGLYDISANYGYRYSPVLAYGFALLVPLGDLGWRLLHVVAALALPNWPMRIVALASWPFWFDVEAGNLMIFVLLAAAWALQGNRFATVAFLALTIAIPRPLMLPIAVWLLWKRPEYRVPALAIFSVHAVAVLATGWGPEWVATLQHSGNEILSPNNLGPSRIVGMAWLIIALPLAAFLTWRGRIGFASLLASPYWLPYYGLMPIVELGRRERR
ncbi:MAG: hypothetical protein ACRDGV_06285 [Candidatus Limnocylindria bacterium]